MVVDSRPIAPEDNTDEEAGRRRGKEAGERLARGERKELEAREVGRKGRCITAPQTAESRRGGVRPR